MLLKVFLQAFTHCSPL